jgi:hypothetical protein
MNKEINSLLGPLEGATRSGDWETAECVAREISRLARVERLSELQRIEEALGARRIRQGESIASLNPIKTAPGSSCEEPWPFG